MSKLDVNLSLSTDTGGRYSYGKTTNYTEIFEITQTVDDSDSFINLALFRRIEDPSLLPSSTITSS